MDFQMDDEKDKAFWCSEEVFANLPEFLSPMQPQYAGGRELLEGLKLDGEYIELGSEPTQSLPPKEEEVAATQESESQPMVNMVAEPQQSEMVTIPMQYLNIEDNLPVTIVQLDNDDKEIDPEIDVSKNQTFQLLPDNVIINHEFEMDPPVVSADEIAVLEFLESGRINQGNGQGGLDFAGGTAANSAIWNFQDQNNIKHTRFIDLELPNPINTSTESFEKVNTAEKKPTLITEIGRIFEYEPNAIRLIEENFIRSRRLLRDDLKYVMGLGKHRSNCKEVNVGETTQIPMDNIKKLHGPHICTLCGRKFVHALGLLRHVERHAMDLLPGSGNSRLHDTYVQQIHYLKTMVKCTICGRLFHFPNEAIAHLRVHFSNDEEEERERDNYIDIPYEEYDESFMQLLTDEHRQMNEQNLKGPSWPVYIKVVILSCVLQCEYCDFMFSDVHFLLHHTSKHSPERGFECLSCEVRFDSSKDVNFHKQMECIRIRENMRVHNASIQHYFVCNVCENKFASISLLTEHRYNNYHFFPRKTTCGIFALHCEFCANIYYSAQDCIQHHQQNHFKKTKREVNHEPNKSRQYLCDICGKSYTQSSHLWQHLRFHQGVKPFACTEPGCTRKFTIRPDLNDHIRKCHTGERPYHCLVCGKRFLTGSVFYQHRLIHRGERRYACKDCGKRFYRADALKNHQRIHTGEKPFSCPYCTKNFRQRGDRDKHIRARHAHLDENARLMMQMQKLQLEQAAAAKKVGRPDNIQIDINDDDSFQQALDPSKIVIVGNVPFPKSMFETMVTDIDGEQSQD